MMWSCMCVRVVICRCEEDDVEMRVTARRKEGGRKAEEGGRRRTEGGGRDGSQKTRTPHRDVGKKGPDILFFPGSLLVHHCPLISWLC